MLLGRAHLEGRKNAELAARSRDRLVEGDMFRDFAACVVEAAIAGGKRRGQSVDAEAAEGRPHGDRRQRGGNLDLPGEDFAELGGFEGLFRGAAPDRMPAIPRTPAIMAQRPDVVVARRRIGQDGSPRRAAVEPADGLGETVGRHGKRQHVVEVGHHEMIVGRPFGAADFVEAGVARVGDALRAPGQPVRQGPEIDHLAAATAVAQPSLQDRQRIVVVSLTAKTKDVSAYDAAKRPRFASTPGRWRAQSRATPANTALGPAARASPGARACDGSAIARRTVGPAPQRLQHPAPARLAVGRGLADRACDQRHGLVVTLLAKGRAEGLGLAFQDAAGSTAGWACGRSPRAASKNCTGRPTRSRSNACFGRACDRHRAPRGSR